ncbi:hypothetical protein GUITHDRAFT_112359 [Guillardia theta CCMP2712]|uniref:Uncharacterized protein n=1 Tax=Guillardia theta (strain CCMP2712) TaxID=905079 RepID=L1IZF2_GUITC|nr:hypothetical protein GUITHDRAFT_112359 [Guillardia theta CCMP2712]EKX41653.1 hypothetical protein GUITHDRAFT_112359 [Guillardia theta CCMP2712]|eukprot:XP_005828633.1 hypothetical protein GUITHDRAFT_112359 [Guillardia theta CCMP2712]
MKLWSTSLFISILSWTLSDALYSHQELASIPTTRPLISSLSVPSCCHDALVVLRQCSPLRLAGGKEKKLSKLTKRRMKMESRRAAKRERREAKGASSSEWDSGSDEGWQEGSVEASSEGSDPRIGNGEQEEPEPEEERKQRRDVGDNKRKGVKAFSPHVAGKKPSEETFDWRVYQWEDDKATTRLDHLRTKQEILMDRSAMGWKFAAENMEDRRKEKQKKKGDKSQAKDHADDGEQGEEEGEEGEDQVERASEVLKKHKRLTKRKRKELEKLEELKKANQMQKGIRPSDMYPSSESHGRVGTQKREDNLFHIPAKGQMEVEDREQIVKHIAKDEAERKKQRTLKLRKRACA